MKKKTLIIGAVLAASGTAAIGLTGATYAATTNTTPHARGVLHRAGGERANAKLDQAVRDGMITEAQKTAFKDEMKTLRAEHKSAVNKDSTKEQRQAERDKLTSEIKAWAETNNFPLAKIFPKLAE